MAVDGIQDRVKMEEEITRLEYEENNKIPTISGAQRFQLCKQLIYGEKQEIEMRVMGGRDRLCLE